MRIISVILFSFLLTSQFFAQSESKPEAMLLEQLTKNKQMLKLENGKLSGRGAEFLFNEARSSQFFLIGEDHGIADLPQFTAALYQTIKADGYNHFAVETGPVTARILEKLVRQKNGFADFNRQYPFGLPFFYWQEECTMLESVLKNSRGKMLWGIDQEFVASSPFHLKRLYELAPNDEAKKAVKEYLDKAQTEFKRVVDNKNPGLMFLASATAADFDKLDAAFKTGKNAEAFELLQELRKSWEIYLNNFTGKGYESNLQRAELMKRHFADYYKETVRLEKTAPKVLFKFGANHVKRGRNFTNVYDIGNFTADLATLNGTKSFHLLVMAIGGTKNAYLPFVANEADKTKKIDANESNYFADVSPFISIAEAKDWSVIDLRPLRPLIHSGKLKNLPRGFADVVWGFDAILLMPEVKASKLFE